MSAALRSLSALLIAVLTCAAWAAKRDVPFLTGRVVDNAEILSAGTVDRITALLKAHETHTTDQVAVLTTRTLGGGSIEEYAVAVFESWKLGQKGKDNGVLVVIVPPERKMRIILFGAFIFGIIGLFTAIGVLTPGMGWYEKAKHDLKTKGRASVGGFVLGGAAGGSSSSWSSSSSSSGGGFSGGGGSS